MPAQQLLFGTFKDAVARLRRDLPAEHPVTIQRSRNTKIYLPDKDEIAAVLASELPARYPVIVRSCYLKKDAGECQYDSKSKQFLIRISTEMSQYAQSLVFLHEWAHAVDWFNSDPKVPHCASWGKEYERCLSFFEEARHSASTCRFDKDRGRFYVNIAKNICEDSAVLVLLHEWAQILRHERKAISTEWSDWYANCLRIFDQVD